MCNFAFLNYAFYTLLKFKTMSKNHLFALLMLFLPLLAWNQECPEMNSQTLVFRSQEDIQSFATTYPNCTELEYALLISGEIEDLTPLSFIQKIKGRLTIRNNDQLTSLAGLDGLQEIEGLFDIDNNETLTDLSALDNLIRVGSLDIRSNESLIHLTGFSNLRQVEGRLNIINNRNLTEINAFPLLESIGEDLKITGEESLITISGFDNLKEIGNQIQINQTKNLSLITGFNQLEKIGSSLLITGNALDSIGGFENLDSIGGSLHLICYPEAYAIAGFSSLKYIGSDLSFDRGVRKIIGFESLNWIGGDFDIVTSNGLVDVPNFPALINIGGSFFIFNNPDLEYIPSFPALQEVGSNITITQNRSLKQIGAFQQIDKINGFVQILRNDSLDVLAAFSMLDTINGYLEFENNGSLSSLDGLEELEYIGEYLELINCTSLVQMDALMNLNHIGGLVKISGNTALESLKGLSSINNTKELSITSNHSLEDLNGLETLTKVKKLSISYNKGLKHIQALRSLERVTDGNLAFFDNELLRNLQGLENLQLVNGGLFISDNENLESITALNSLDLTDLTGLFVKSNRKLRYCNAPGICEYIASAPNGLVTIEGNASGCDNAIEILRYCTESLPTVTGKVFIDQNCNSIQDTLDTVVPEVLLLESSTDMPFAITDSSGNYVRGLAFDTTAQYKLRSLNYFTVEPTQYAIMTADTIALYDSLDFSLCPIETIRDLNADLISLNPPRPGFVHEYELCIKNTGTTPETANISFSFTGEDNALWIDSLFVDGEKMSAASANWTSVSIAPFARSCFSINVYLVPDESILGQPLLPKATIDLVGNQDTHPTDNVDSLNLVIVGSYDPNDKRVSIDSLNFAKVDGQLYLEYTIRFQNTGTFMAEFIEVTDTINEAFDMTSFTMLSSSHNYQLKFKADGLLSWFFPDIFLPPVSENELGSNGYIKFGIKTKPGLKLADILSNKAFIYFDFNSPIITNEATTQFFTITSLSSIPNTFNAKIFPNPAKNYFTVEIDNLIGEQKIEFQLFSSDGKLIEQRSIPSSTDRFTVPISHLPPGIYLVQLSIGGQRTIHKMIK